ncbi:hypothetical protein HPB48_003064 [Haemaphysalis longicornis]|uniref:F-box domain-containing protein n=1 Tax=Haemaphysalis longicornis TaxID=44386 RepID=A0A9J6FH37_HAELO|nr:hypothetical protein HPB48_003064 [Haemaphysalis longicornis]
MEFGDLPLELRLKIFSYLPQRTLLTIADVSCEWKDLAFDPLLWTKVTISPSFSARSIVQILERATLLRSLHITGGATVYIDVIAPFLPRFRTLSELILNKDALSFSVMLETLKNCPSLSGVMLLGEFVLMDSEVAVLSSLPHLKSLVLSPGSSRSRRSSPPDKPRMPWTPACPHLEYLHIGALKNTSSATETVKLGEFLGLRCLTVNSRGEDNWFNATSPALTSLKCFDVPEMRLEKRELQHLLRNCGLSLRHIEFNAHRLAGSVLDVLSVCRSLESMHIYGLSGDNLSLAALREFPKLVRASLNADESAVGTIEQLPLMVDSLFDVPSPLDGAWMVLDVFCTSQVSRDAAMPAVSAFKDFIDSNTRVSKEQVQDTERRGGGSRPWVWRIVTTWFPPAIKTLKLLELNLGGR